MNVRKVPEIRFREFNDDWEQRNLGDVLLDLYNGQTPSRYREDFWNGNINWLTSGELNRGIVLDTVEKITKEGQNNAHLRVVPSGTFVMAITGLEAAGTRGNCAILGLDTTLNQSCMALFPDKKQLDNLFLFEWYRKVGEEYGNQFTQGTKQQSYNADIVKKLEITLPSVEEQKQLGKFFFSLDNLITLHQRKHKKLLAVKKSMLEKMFPQNGAKVPEIRFEGFTDAWEQRKLGDIGSILTCKRIFKEQTSENGEIPFYKNGTLGLEADAYISRETYEEYKRLYPFPKPGDVLISVVGSIGRTAEYKGKDEYFQDSNIVWLDTNENVIDKSFLRVSYQVIEWIIEGSTIKHLYNDNILRSKIWMPSLKEQKSIGTFFDKLDNLITLHQRKLDNLLNIKKSLLEKMFP